MASEALTGELNVAASDVTTLARHRLDRFMDVLVDAIAVDDVAHRLARAGVQVRIDLNDLPDTVITLQLDSSPVKVVFGSPRRPDVRLWMWSADLEAVLHRGDYLPMQILAGKTRFEGTVRKFLRVLPILTGAVQVVTGRAAAES